MGALGKYVVCVRVKFCYVALVIAQIHGRDSGIVEVDDGMVMVLVFLLTTRLIRDSSCLES